MKTFVLLLINLFASLTAISQSDTLNRAEKDSLIALLPRINTELKDYDLLKQKMYLQTDLIKALQDKSRAQSAINVRKEVKLDAYSTSVIALQTNNLRLSTELGKVTKQRNFSRLENWVWRGLAVYLTGKTLKLY